MSRHRIFVSYRRASAGWPAQALRRALTQRFGDVVFVDVAEAQPGEPFPDRLMNALSESKVVLVLVDDSWSSAALDKSSWMWKPSSWLRQEVEEAIRLRGLGRMLLLPLIVENPPHSTEGWPEFARELMRTDYVQLFPGGNYDQQVSKLSDIIATSLRVSPVWLDKSELVSHGIRAFAMDWHDLRRDARLTDRIRKARDGDRIVLWCTNLQAFGKWLDDLEHALRNGAKIQAVYSDMPKVRRETSGRALLECLAPYGLGLAEKEWASQVDSFETAIETAEHYSPGARRRWEFVATACPLTSLGACLMPAEASQGGVAMFQPYPPLVQNRGPGWLIEGPSPLFEFYRRSIDAFVMKAREYASGGTGFEHAGQV